MIVAHDIFEMEIKRIFLIGFMGSGKSTLGRRLSTEMGWPFSDLDDLFEKKYHTTIENYFKTLGEEAFRKAEQQVLQEVLNEDKIIIATGGGTPCFYDNMEQMNAHGLTIYLKLSVNTLAQRLGGKRQVRPLVKGKSGEELINFITEKLAEREHHYEKANVVVDAEVLGVEGYIKIIEASGSLME